jgi:AraC-like DNA-binding protein
MRLTEQGSRVAQHFPGENPSGILSAENFWEYRIQKGFRISRLDIAPEGKRIYRYESDRPVLNFGFVLAGSFINLIKAPDLPAGGFSNHEGASGIIYLPRREGELIVPGQNRVCVVHVHLSLPVFYDLFNVDASDVPGNLRLLLDGPVEKPYVFRSGMSMQVRFTLDRLLQEPPQGTPFRLFYQGIALDLVAGQIALANTRPHLPGAMSFDDHDRVIHARDLLTENLSSPPCLRQLSRKTGLNINKLQQGFYRLYGVSVFKYLHQCRMQEANRIFHETDMNVSQAASAVGYTNISHFSRAYKKRFNILPKKHMARIRN